MVRIVFFSGERVLEVVFRVQTETKPVTIRCTGKDWLVTGSPRLGISVSRRRTLGVPGVDPSPPKVSL